MQIGRAAIFFTVIFLGFGGYLIAQEKRESFNFQTLGVAYHWAFPEGELAMTKPLRNHGYAQPGYGISIEYSAYRTFNPGVKPFGFSWTFSGIYRHFPVDVRALHNDLNDFYSRPEAQGANFEMRHDRWSTFDLQGGIGFMYVPGPVWFELKGKAGLGLSLRTPVHQPVQGNYVPAEMGQFFLTDENETERSSDKAQWSFGAEGTMNIPIFGTMVIQLGALWMRSNHEVEMEVIRESNGVFELVLEDYSINVESISLKTGLAWRF